MRNISHCPICGCTEFEALPGYDHKPGPEVYEFLGLPENNSRWSICKSCGFLFQNPRPSPDAIIKLYGSGLYRSGKEYSDEFFRTRYHRPLDHLAWAKKQAALLSDSPILDIGAGFGGAVKAFQDQGFSAEGIEPDKNLCDAARERFGVQLINSNIEECVLSDNSFGLVYSSHVHEHFDDLMQINSKIYNWLKPGGYLLCVLPTYRFAAKNGQGFINVFHNSIFTRTSLHNMFVKCGLSPVAFKYPYQHSLAEVWGLARKPLSSTSAASQTARDNWKLVEWEVQNSPELFELLYKLADPVVRNLKKGLKWILRK